MSESKLVYRVMYTPRPMGRRTDGELDLCAQAFTTEGPAISNALELEREHVAMAIWIEAELPTGRDLLSLEQIREAVCLTSGRVLRPRGGSVALTADGEVSIGFDQVLAPGPLAEAALTTEERMELARIMLARWRIFYARAAGLRYCRVCGWMDGDTCANDRHWVRPDLCNACGTEADR